MTTPSGQIRRGLPRVDGGNPWPPVATTPGANVSGRIDARPSVQEPTATSAAPGAATLDVLQNTVRAAPAGGVPGAAAVPQQLRRGLPRVPGGNPWPPQSGGSPQASRSALPTVEAVEARDAGDAAEANKAIRSAPEMVATANSVAEVELGPSPAATAAVEPGKRESAATSEVAAPPPSAARSASPDRKPPAKPQLYHSRTLVQWGKLLSLAAMAAVAAAALLVLVARGVTTLPGVPEFLEEYPGEYQVPKTVESGFPWWLQWTHFMNIFLMVLIIRSGYQVRTQQKPPAFWTPKGGGKKISIYLWLHQSLDILWLTNGIIFVVLLFVSGHWMRIVPSSWAVFPGALSALLQYMTLDWPVENGWVNYNSLQQLMYFIVVFIAAPLAAFTGVRMSELWPKNAQTLNRIYPVEFARAIHFPIMLFFVLFIIVHVFLVLSTGALRNLNHMFGGTNVVNWTGFWLFAAAIAFTAAAWFAAARPLILAPIARLFGQVSSR